MDGLRRILFLVLLGAAGALFLRRFVAEGIFIATGSMEPTLPVGRHVFVNKTAYWLKPPARGDIVVFPSPVDPAKDLVKRVIGVPGDEVALDRKTVLLNGKPLAEPYVQHTRPRDMLVGDNLQVGRVPTGRVFVLGDNRDVSGDSRDWKDPATGEPIRFVSVSRLKGKVIGVY